jgi:hypothetical protein
MFNFCKKYLLLVFTICLFFTSNSQDNTTKGKLFWYGYMKSIAVNKLKLYITYNKVKPVQKLLVNTPYAITLQEHITMSSNLKNQLHREIRQ